MGNRVQEGMSEGRVTGDGGITTVLALSFIFLIGSFSAPLQTMMQRRHHACIWVLRKATDLSPGLARIQHLPSLGPSLPAQGGSHRLSPTSETSATLGKHSQLQDPKGNQSYRNESMLKCLKNINVGQQSNATRCSHH